MSLNRQGNALSLFEHTVLDVFHNFHLNKLMSSSSLSPPQALGLIHQGTTLLLTLIPDPRHPCFYGLGRSETLL